MSDRPFDTADAVGATDLVEARRRDRWDLVVTLATGRREYPLDVPCELVVGRGETAYIVVDHKSVSREHAKLVVKEGATIEDLGSSNGTRVDGHLVPRGTAAYVRAGSVIELGDVLLLLRPPETETSLGAGQTAGVGVEMGRALELASAAAKSSLHVYVSGERGAGKTWLTERIHRASPRSTTALVRVHARGAGPEDVLGALDRAASGMVLLSDVAALTRPAQVALQMALATNRIARAD